jgi:hypothetical protein
MIFQTIFPFSQEIFAEKPDLVLHLRGCGGKKLMRKNQEANIG